jgi:hypothetical protein
VADRRFDLVVSNSPFVVSPGERFSYRDSGLGGDELCRRLVGQAPEHLAEGGWAQTLANWLHVRGEDWRERLAQWVVPTGCDAWVAQREVQDPAEYAETQRLRLTGGLRRSGAVDSVGAAVLAGCDGSRALATVLAAVADDCGLDAADLRMSGVAAVRALVEEGFLHPA